MGQPITPVVTFLSPPSATIPSKPASPDAKLDTVSTTQGLSLFTVCSTPNITTDQLHPTAISSSVGDARAKISFCRSARARSKGRLRRMQQHVNKSYDDYGRLTIARQHKRD